MILVIGLRQEMGLKIHGQMEDSLGHKQVGLRTGWR